jgi:rRNA maturation endonuclease Nob1
MKSAPGASQEVTFHVTLPSSAFISSFKMIIENETYPGEVKEKEEAKRAYEAAQEKGESAGIIRATPRNSNVFQA